MLFIGLPVLLHIIDSVFSPSAYFSYYYVAPFITLIGLGLIFSWYWTIGVNIFKKLPQGINMHLKRFKALLVTTAFLLFLTVFLQNLLSDALSDGGLPDWFFWLIILQLITMPCMLYCIYFIAKSLKASEKNRDATSSDYSGEFMMLLFLPIGVWFLQPRIKKLFEDRQELSAE